MNRRNFLKSLGGVSAAVAAMTMGNPLKHAFRIANASHSTFTGGKTLVCVYLRGGIDGLNIVIPHGYPNGSGYYASDFRPTLAIAKPDGVTDSGAALDLDGGLGLHPNMKAMHQMYLNNNLAVFPAVHYANASRSHFDGQHFTESAETHLDGDGWLQRYLADSAPGPAGAIRGVGISSDLPQSLNGGSEIVSVFNDLRNFDLGIADPGDESAVLAGLTAVYNQTPDMNRLYAPILHDFGRVALDDLAVVQSLVNDDHDPNLNPSKYQTASGVSNYTSSTFGRQMKQTALLIKAQVGLEVACLSRGGFDNHSNQGTHNGTQGSRIGDVSDNLGAFFDDLDADGFMDDVVVLLMSEFGRTSFENGSFGTDHAHATCYFVAGTTNTIKGDIYLGHENLGGEGGIPDFSKPITDWIAYNPLAVENMVRERYLNHTIDYQNVMGEILTDFLGANYGTGNPALPTLLPEYSYDPANKVGFLKSA